MNSNQSALLAFLRQRALTSDFSPTFQEMADHLGITSKGHVAKLIDGLEQRGQVVRIKRRLHRGIIVVGISDYQCGYRDGLAQARRSEAAA